MFQFTALVYATMRIDNWQWTIEHYHYHYHSFTIAHVPRTLFTVRGSCCHRKYPYLSRLIAVYNALITQLCLDIHWEPSSIFILHSTFNVQRLTCHIDPYWPESTSYLISYIQSLTVQWAPYIQANYVYVNTRPTISFQSFYCKQDKRAVVVTSYCIYKVYRDA